jgi:hypothetical protein
VKVVFDTGGCNLNWFSFTPVGESTVAGSATGARVTKIQGSTFSSQSGIGTEPCSEGGLDVMDIGDGEWVSYSNVTFDGVKSFTARTASNNYPGTIEFHRDSTTGTLLGTCSAPYTGGWQSWTTISCPAVAATSGTGTLYLVFHGASLYNQLPNLEWFQLVNSVQIGADTLTGNGGVGVQACSEGGNNIDDVGDGEWASYSNVVFDGVTTFQARVASANFPGTIEFRRDSTTGQLLATCSAPYTGGWQTWTTVSCAATGTTGTGTLYLVFHGPSLNSQLPNVHWFKMFAGGVEVEGSSLTGNGGVGLENCSEGGQNVMDIGDGEWASYSNVDFTNVSQFVARVASNNFPGTIEFRRDSTTGTLLGTCSAPFTGGWQSWVSVACPAAPTSGTGALYLVFHGGSLDSQLPNLHWFRLQ